MFMSFKSYWVSRRLQLHRYYPQRINRLQELRDFGAWLIDQAYPEICLMCHCETEEEKLCAQCFAELSLSEQFTTRACTRCALPLDQITRLSDTDSNPSKTMANRTITESKDRQQKCSSCRHKKLEWDHAESLWIYDGMVKEAIIRCKYTHNHSLAHHLGILLGKRLTRHPSFPRPNLVTHIPSHWTRRISRGGEAVHGLAQAVAQTIRVPCRRTLSLRRPIAKQAWLRKSTRSENLRNAFKPSPSLKYFGASSVENQDVLVIDDVLTTGSTANEFCRTLKELGAKSLAVAVIARATQSTKPNAAGRNGI